VNRGEGKCTSDHAKKAAKKKKRTTSRDGITEKLGQLLLGGEIYIMSRHKQEQVSRRKERRGGAKKGKGMC